MRKLSNILAYFFATSLAFSALAANPEPAPTPAPAAKPKTTTTLSSAPEAATPASKPAPVADSEKTPPKTETPPATSPAGSDLTLESLLHSTAAGNGQIHEANQDIEIARSHLAQARAAMWPKASAMVLGAPIFEERGDALHSQSNWGKWGPQIITGIQVAQPLYTFGQIGSYQSAAQSEVEAKSELADARRNEVLAQAKEFYYGYLMAVEFDKLLEDLRSFLSEAVDSAEEQVKDKKKKSTVKPHDVFHLKTSLNDIEQKQLLAKQSVKTAEKALAWIGNVSFGRVGAKALPIQTYEKKTLDEYITLAHANRPELKALPAGIQARESLADAKRAQSYPVVFLGGFFSYNWSPVRDKQDSVYANDPFNSTTGGGGLGLKFDLEFARHSAEAQEQRAEAQKLKATQSYANPGIDLQVRKAFWELEQAEAGLDVATKRRDTAKKWFVQSAMGWSIGITPAKDLLEALEGHGMARKNYIETVYSYDLALSKLSLAIGKEVAQLSY